jgi:hypothetical protein
MRQRLQQLSDEAVRLVDGFGTARVGSDELADGLRHLPQTATADPSVALVRIRKALQFVVEAAYERQFHEPPNTRPLENLVQRLVKEGDLSRRLAAYGNLVRDLGNIGAHSFGEAVTLTDVVQALEQLLPLLRWHREQVGSAVPDEQPNPPSAALREPSGSPAARHDAGIPSPVAQRGWRRLTGVFSLTFAFTAGAVALVALLRWFPSQPTSTPSVPPPVHQISNQSARLPAGAVLRLVYEGTPRSHPVEGAIVLDFRLRFRKDRQGDWRKLSDGERLSRSDDYKLEVRSNETSYLYVFQVDSRGKLTCLFPALSGCQFSSGSNPLAAEREVRIPFDRTIRLDDHLGLEHVYAVASSDRWPELETALAAAEAAPGAGEDVTEPLGLSLRGVGGTLRETTDGPVKPEELPVKCADETFSGRGLSVLVAERWFRHVAPGQSAD